MQQDQNLVTDHLSSAEIESIDKVLKENCETHDYDLIRIIFDDFDYVFIAKNADSMKKLKLLLHSVFINSTDNDMSIFMTDGDNNTIIDEDLDVLGEKYNPDVSDMGIYEDLLNSYIIDQGYSLSKVCKLYFC